MLSTNEIGGLLTRLCVKGGFCDASDNVFDGVPFTVEDYTRVVREAEGMDYGYGGPMYRYVREIVEEAFKKHYEDCDLV